MIWHSFGDFLAMGGYALYVWGSFGLTFALMALEVWMAGHSQREALAQLREQALSQELQGDWQS
jgi:heme exporter protein D